MKALSITASVFLLLISSSIKQTLATRHSFNTKHDSRYFIGPIGPPYGFLKNGVYNLTVFDFSVEVNNKHSHLFSSKKDGDNDKEEDVLKHVEAGFILRKFESEAEYARFEGTIEENPSICSFEPYLEHDGILSKNDDPLNDDNGEDAGGEEEEEETIFAATDGIFLGMNNPSKTWKPHTPTKTHTFSIQEEGLYFLLFQLCPTTATTKDDNNDNDDDTSNKNAVLHNLKTTFELDLKYHNYDTLGYISYLTAGEMPLPTMFLYFSISYALCLGIWVQNIRKIQMGKRGGPMSRERDGGGTSGGGQPVIYSIHHMMTVLLTFKTISIFFESVRYHYIRLSGHAELWSVVYYTLAFIKGIFLFTVILLIGSGWSFVKPFLNVREKKVICLVLVLQVIDNVAVVILQHGMVGERLYEDWSAILHLVDILCCCAVLVPIVWQVNSLEGSVERRSGGTNVSEGAGEDEEEDMVQRNTQDAAQSQPKTADEARMLSKLKMFRSFYLLVVAYIYFTRIVVYLFATVLGYRHTWLQYFVTELGTLVFYVVVGLQFRPMVENPYLELKKEEDDDGDYGNEMEMMEHKG